MSKARVVVRPVELMDVSDLYEHCFSMNTLDEVQARIEANLRLHEEGRGIQLVAEVGGAVIGTVALVRNTHPFLSHRAELVDVVVHGDHQDQGLARRLVEESKPYARGLGIEILETSCRAGTVAKVACRRLGIVEYGRLPRGIIEPGDEPKIFDQVFYYLPL
jgi:GNAT superfamily N-acetyltransferase